MDSILVIEDTQSLREVLCTVLNCEGYHVTGVGSAEEGLEKLKTDSFTMVLSDLKLPGMSGLEFLKAAKTEQTTLPIIVMTAYGNIDIAVQAMKHGATDFITKPFDPAMLCNLLSQVAQHRRIIDRNLSNPAGRKRKFITQDPSAQLILHQARKVAPLKSPVLILGESGTGKELIARLIHENSPRAEMPFVAVNGGSVPNEMLESEFFGHEEGSFTGATEKRIGLFSIADKGTIFLDEIGNMSTALQMKLLRVLQESEIRPLGSNKTQKIDVRVISATNVNLNESLKNKDFREDLYYRLGVVILEIPPLRERKDDIELLANFFIKSLSNELGREALPLTKDAISILCAYDWPGNVRELENVIEQSLVFASDKIGPECFEFGQVNTEAVDEINTLTCIASEAAKKAEIEAIRKIMAQTKGNKTKAAKALGVSYKTLLNKVKEYDLDLN